MSLPVLLTVNASCTQICKTKEDLTDVLNLISASILDWRQVMSVITSCFFFFTVYSPSYCGNLYQCVSMSVKICSEKRTNQSVSTEVHRLEFFFFFSGLFNDWCASLLKGLLKLRLMTRLVYCLSHTYPCHAWCTINVVQLVALTREATILVVLMNVSIVITVQVGCGFNSRIGHLCAEFVCPLSFSVGSLLVLELLLTFQRQDQANEQHNISAGERLFVSLWSCDKLLTCPLCNPAFTLRHL